MSSLQPPQSVFNDGVSTTASEMISEAFCKACSRDKNAPKTTANVNLESQAIPAPVNVQAQLPASQSLKLTASESPSGVQMILNPQILPAESDFRVEPTESRFQRMAMPVILHYMYLARYNKRCKMED